MASQRKWSLIETKGWVGISCMQVGGEGCVWMVEKIFYWEVMASAKSPVSRKRKPLFSQGIDKSFACCSLRQGTERVEKAIDCEDQVNICLEIWASCSVTYGNTW